MSGPLDLAAVAVGAKLALDGASYRKAGRGAWERVVAPPSRSPKDTPARFERIEERDLAAAVHPWSSWWLW